MFHTMTSAVEPPLRFTYPFAYEPHQLCREAARRVKAYISRYRPEWHDELARGKMLGVLVCRNSRGELGFLAAYSGQLGGREDWPWFVPAVFDYLQPEGHFKCEEADISAINRMIDGIYASAAYQLHHRRLLAVEAEALRQLEAYHRLMTEAKKRRDELRPTASPELLRQLVAESQHQKAEYRRLKKHWAEQTDAVQGPLSRLEADIHRLQQERRRRSEALQQWLFSHFNMLNARGERRSLTSIFANTRQHIPPSGADECCAPKLLQYAYEHRLQPLCMAEFWQGASPQGEVRHADHFYPACRSKCKPILEHMLQGLDVDPDPLADDQGAAQLLTTVYEDDHLVVVNKPSGLLSVPGKSQRPSVASILGERYRQSGGVMMVHRLDMDTSGLMVVARSLPVYHALQRQFLEHQVQKQYVALLDGTRPNLPVGATGEVRLPLRPDPDDRPRQVVDHRNGRTAVTHYEVLAIIDGRTRVLLTPLTGRTHQLRVHCAHADGLALPIVGDPLYGSRADRLYLHAVRLKFVHPVTGEPMAFEQDESSSE